MEERWEHQIYYEHMEIKAILTQTLEGLQSWLFAGQGIALLELPAAFGSVNNFQTIEIRSVVFLGPLT